MNARAPSAALPLALTMGEPAGIGAEITLKAWLEMRSGAVPFFYIGPTELLRSTAGRIGLDAPVARIGAPEAARACFADAVPVLDLAMTGQVVEGKPSPATAAAVIGSVEMAVTFARNGGAAALVTNPIQKAVLAQAGFAHPGHTEFLQELAGPGFTSTMMLVGAGNLRVVPVTIHRSLASAIDALTTDDIVAKAVAVAEGLKRDFGITRPRIAVAGLNPHAGEAGNMGDEEIRVIAPAIDALRRLGHEVVGPLSPDTMFTHRARQRYDVAVCMYHDQALIPLKTLDVDGGVNVTLGLPFVRTSPDHGTALDIAGKGIADPGSLVAALRLAGRMAVHRMERTET
jgi:4-hydroxythreonine-4-phosphate dehydrogenase